MRPKRPRNNLTCHGLAEPSPTRRGLSLLEKAYSDFRAIVVLRRSTHHPISRPIKIGTIPSNIRYAVKEEGQDTSSMGQARAVKRSTNQFNVLVSTDMVKRSATETMSIHKPRCNSHAAMTGGGHRRSKGQIPGIVSLSVTCICRFSDLVEVPCFGLPPSSLQDRANGQADMPRSDRERSS